MRTEYLGITIDRTRDKTMTAQARELVSGYYLKGDEKSPQEAYARACVAYSDGDNELAQRLYDAVSNGWFMFSSPILSNAPAPGEQAKGLPISCFLSYIPDTLDGLISHQSELAWLSVKGGGVGGHWSDVRAVSDKAPSPIPFIKVADSAMTAYKQGQTRKGSYAAYLDISHPDIIEFLNIRIPTGGDSNRKCFNINNAVNVTDDFMDAVVAGSDWNLVDPNDNSVRDVVSARDLWERILETRFRTGEPYVNFIDEANRKLPQALKESGLKIKGSNL
ncbi:MAG: ribonucleotide-diphosphate reductase subunit alpha, partial [Gammaproteobacteria bacterium]|nr:ribonucleotide-diphosphate reductase subunit alpha [Gammaproteobacteria bacterium]